MSGRTPRDPSEAPADAGTRMLVLSPSRAGDFRSCPLLYRFRAIDRLPEPPSRPAVRGTLVHAVLERMFTRAAGDRTEGRTIDSIEGLWSEMRNDQPDLVDLVPDADREPWLAEAAGLVRAYFRLEDPAGFSPQACEEPVQLTLTIVPADLAEPGEPPDRAEPTGVPLKGFIDRIDVAATGEVRIVDYKTGRSPSEHYETAVLYQLKFYAMMLQHLRGVLPTELKLIYLGDSTALRYRPDQQELDAFERGVVALWRTIWSAAQTGDFPARRSSSCRWCAHQAMCPEFGGTPPPYPGMPGTDQTIGPGR
ncbi:putative RecB family exonuclease [Nakamurella sp. UYEF19]|uniref:RecB family exonuclease n=1 Tax=Nakamurella sp. UYEF19 TaxID=1756392 RepID=UPI003398F936